MDTLASKISGKQSFQAVIDSYYERATMQSQGERPVSEVFIPTFNETSKLLDTGDVNTAILEASSNTNFPVLDGFWM
jgi:hypothetical protein